MDGVLGGYGHVNAADIKASEDFLNAILAERFPDAGRGRRLVALGTPSISFISHGNVTGAHNFIVSYMYLLAKAPQIIWTSSVFGIKENVS